MAEELRELRVTKQIPAKDMVAVVQSLYPKYDKTVQSKCENGEAYGVTIRPDAMTALYERFAPERLEPPKRTRHGQHRLTCRISCASKMRTMRRCNGSLKRLAALLSRTGSPASSES